MDNNNLPLKKIFWLAAGLALLAVTYGIVVYTNAYARSLSGVSARTFAVLGEGRVVAKNDIANFTYSVQVEGDKDIAAIKKESDGKTNKIHDFLRQQDVEEKDVKTVIYNLEPRYRYYPCPAMMGAPCQPAEIIGYTLSQTEEVKIRNLENVEAIVSGVVAQGANTVSQLNFTIDDMTALRAEAKALAIRNALAEAEILARAAGFGLGHIVSIDEGGYLPFGYSGRGGDGKVMMEVADMAPSVASFEAGSGEIVSNVSVRFEIN